jgi:hypothetical protein
MTGRRQGWRGTLPGGHVHVFSTLKCHALSRVLMPKQVALYLDRKVPRKVPNPAAHPRPSTAQARADLADLAACSRTTRRGRRSDRQLVTAPRSSPSQEGSKPYPSSFALACPAIQAISPCASAACSQVAELLEGVQRGSREQQHVLEAPHLCANPRLVEC